MYSKIKKLLNLETFLIFLIVATGSFVRVYQLSSYPSGFHGDEGWTGIVSRQILIDGFVGFWSGAALGQAALSYYWTALLFRFFGQSIEVARLSFSLLNCFALPFYYLFIRKLFSKTTALISTAVFTFGYIPIAFSRRADFISISFSFFPAMYFFLVAFQNGSFILFILAGIFIGLSHHMYAGLWLSPLLFFGWTVYELIKQRSKLNFLLLRVGVLFASYLVVASPLLYKAYHNPTDFFSRTRMVSIFSNAKHIQSYTPDNIPFHELLLKNTLKTFGIFTHVSDTDTWNSFNDNPVYDSFSATLFIIGLILSIFFFTKKQKIYLWIIFLFFLIPSIITVDTPSFRRSMISIYISFIFIGYTLSFLIEKTQKYKAKLAIVSITLVSLIVAYLGCYNLYMYFYRYASGPIAKDVLAYPLVPVSEYLNKLPKPYMLYFYSSRWAFQYETLQFLVPNLEGENRSIEFENKETNDNEISLPAAFIFLPNYLSEIGEIEKEFPNGQKKIFHDSSGELIYIGYYVPKK